MSEGAALDHGDGSGPTVFISYASQDAAVADVVVAALEKSGRRCWIAPRDVIPGEFYADSIVHAIDTAQIAVVILSRNAIASPHVLREIERAVSKRRPVISLRIDLAPLPAALEYFLNTSQWLDASNGGIERSLPRLTDAVRRTLAAGDAPSGVPGVSVMPQANNTLRSAAALPARQRIKRALLALGFVAVLGLGYFALDALWLSQRIDRTPAANPATPRVLRNSIAVLPFVDMSEKKDQEYFADGMAEELIDLLAKAPGLHVIARTSSFS